MLDYILGGLSFSEANIEAIWKFLRRQKRINNRLSVVAVGMVVYIVRAEIRGAIQRSEIDQLQKEVEELKSQKGE